MRSLGLALLAALPLACGGDAPPSTTVAPSGSTPAPANRAPVIREATISPSEPVVGDALLLAVKVTDPDNDRISLQIEWFRNSRLETSGTSATLDTSEFVRGDAVYAVVTASDGQETARQQVEPVLFGNQAPRVMGIRILPEQPSATTPLTAVAEVRDLDGDDFEMSYEWYVNGKRVPGIEGAELPARTFQRGDKVRVHVLATDRQDEGEPLRSAELQIPNAPPEITSDPSSAAVSSGRYKYAVKAKDADGDRPLRYRLVQGPEGMDIDLISGVVSWRVPANAGGSYPVEIAVSDALGAEVRQSFNVELRWEAEPANTQ